MASTLYWVGGSGTWDSSSTANWSTSSGGASGAGPPVAGDTVNFDSGSGTGATVTVAASAAAATVTVNKSDLKLLHGAANTSFCTGTLTLTSGKWDTGGYDLTLGAFSSSNSNTRTVTFGASQITISGGAGTAWNTATNSNLTVTLNTATVTFTSLSGPSIAGGLTNLNGMSFVITGDAATLGGGPTLAALTVTGRNAKTASCYFSAPWTVTGVCTIGGNTTQGVNRLLVGSNVVGTQRTITAGSYVINGDVDFQDINLAYSGAASWTNSGSAFIGDCGGNGGAVTTNATTPAAQSQSIASSFSWSTAAWTSRVPLPQDDVTITGNGSGKTITADMPRLGKGIDMSAATGGPTFSLSQASSFFGSLAFATSMTTNSSATALTAAGRSTYTLTSNGITVQLNLTVQAPSGTYTLQDDWTTILGRQVAALAGTFSDGGKNITTAVFVSTGTLTRTITLSGTTTLIATGNQTVWNVLSSATVNHTGTITITSTDSGVTKTFAGGGKTYGTLKHISTGSAGLTITGDNTFATLDLECTTARTVTLPASGTQTITSAITLQGASGQTLSVVSSSPGTATTIKVQQAATSTRAFHSLSSDVAYKFLDSTTTPLTDTFTSAGKPTAKSSTSTLVTFSAGTSAVCTLLSSTATSLTDSFTTAGVLTRFGSSASSFTVPIGSAGVLTAKSEIVMPLTVSFMTVEAVEFVQQVSGSMVFSGYTGVRYHPWNEFTLTPAVVDVFID